MTTMIEESGLFDRTWYMKTYGSDLRSAEDPLDHYVRFGARKGYFPNPLFDSKWYLRTYRLGFFGHINPLYDYIINSNAFLRDPNPYFSTKFYLEAYPDIGNHPDIIANKRTALHHYMNWGEREGRETGPDFWSERYAAVYPDVASSEFGSVAHFLHVGRKGGRKRFIFRAGRQPLAVDETRRSRMVRWMDPAWARTERDARVGRSVRLCVFVLGCFAYAVFRPRVPLAPGSQAIGPVRFVVTAIQRFWAEGFEDVPLAAVTFLTRPFARTQSDNFLSRVLAAPRPSIKLYLANSFKAIGLFSDAEALCRDLERSDRFRSLALLTLGDLYLVQAIWASEFSEYASHRAAINPARILDLAVGQTWHDRTFKDAIALLEMAAALEPHEADLWLLLTFARLSARQWSSARDAAVHLATLDQANDVARYAQAFALFGEDSEAGFDLFQQTVREAGERNIHGLATIVGEDADFISPDHVTSRLMADARSLTVNYALIYGGRASQVRTLLSLPSASLFELRTAQLLPEYGTVLVGGTALLAGESHMRRCHDQTFCSAIVTIAEKRAIYTLATPVAAPIEKACFIGNNGNYFHWLLEDLPRVEAVTGGSAYDDVSILVDRNAAPWQRKLLERVGVEPSRLCEVDFSRPVSVSRLVLPPRLSKNLVVHPEAVRFLRDRLVPGASTAVVRPGKRLYLTRASAAVKRGFLNEPEVIERLRSAGFAVVDPGGMSIDEQIELFSDVEIVAAPGGAALSNLVFAPPATKVLAFSADAILSETFTSLASAIGQSYVLCAGASLARADRYWIWSRFDFAIAKADLDRAMEAVIG
ncbi:glycosyltransferase 61 family protein [Methylobacterium sp. D48H]